MRHSKELAGCCCCCVASVVSESVRPHRQQPTRLPCPWDSQGKNTGVGCHFLLQCRKVKSESEVAQSCPTQRIHGLQPPGSSVHRIFPGKSTGASWLNINNTKLWTNKKDMCQIYICFFKKWLDVMCHFTRQQIAQAWGKTWEIIIANWNRIFYTAPKTLILIISGSSWRK